MRRATAASVEPEAGFEPGAGPLGRHKTDRRYVVGEGVGVAAVAAFAIDPAKAWSACRDWGSWPRPGC